MTDLRPVCSSNFLFKYADDCYLITPGKNSNTIPLEIENLNNWCQENNLNLNVDKTKELIVSKKSCNTKLVPNTGLDRVDNLKVLGVIVDKHLNFNSHVEYVISRAAQSLYAMKKIQSHGLKGKELETVFRATTLSKITYASQAWWGFLNKESLSKMNGPVKRAVKWSICKENTYLEFTHSFNRNDQILFQNILNNSHHTLHNLLPPTTSHSYNLRKRPHNRQIACATSLFQRTFFGRMLHTDTY